MEPPPGMKLEKDEILALDRPIYGTRQGGRMFSDALDEHLRKIGFIQNTADPCVWMRIRNGKAQYIASYVDDCTVCVEDDEARDELMAEMRQRFEIKQGEGEPIKYLLGILIQQDIEKGTITLTQELAAQKLADVFSYRHRKRKCEIDKAPNAALSEVAEAARKNSARFRVQIFISHRKFVVHQWMHKTRHRRGNRNFSKTRSCSGKGTCESGQKINTVCV